jgi:hypothetical protein
VRLVGHIAQFLNKHCTHLAQLLNHIPVMHDLMPHVNRRTEQLDGALDNFDSAINAGTEAAGIGEKNLHD